MQKGGVYNDSLNRCDLYSNPYDTRMQANPALVKHRQEMYSKSRDVLEAKQTRLEKEIFRRLQEGSLGLGDGNFLIVARVGKYFLLALILPIYIFSYGLPKWLLTEAIPKLFQAGADALGKAQSLAAFALHRFVAGVKQVSNAITSPILRFINVRVDKARAYCSYLKQKFLGFVAVATAPYRFLRDKIYRPASRAAQQILAFANGLSERLKAAVEKWQQLKADLRRFFVYLPNNVLNKISALGETLNQRFHSLAEALNKPYQTLSSGLREAASYFNRGLENLNAVWSKAFAILYRKPTENLSRVLEGFNRLAAPVKDWFSNSFAGLRERFDRFRNTSDRLKNKLYGASLSLLNRVKARIESSAATIAKITTAVVAELNQIMPPPVIALFTPFVFLAKAPFQIYRNKDGFKLKIRRVSENLKRGFSFLQKRINSTLRYAQTKFRQMAPKLKALPVWLWHLVKSLLGFFLNGLKGAFFIIRLMLAWLKALIRYGIHLAKEAARELLTQS